VNSTEILVIGGGPAGLAMAIAARQRGLRVMVVDGMQPPIDKACGEGLMPDGLTAIEKLGLRLPVAEGYPFRGIRFLSRDLSADALFPDGGRGLAMRRTVLHRAMAERASQVGAKLLWGAVVRGVMSDGVYVGSDFVRVRRWAGLEECYRPRLRYAFRRHYRVEPWTDHMEVHWGDRCQGYATAVSEDQVCVALASHDPNLRLEDGLKDLPWLNARLRGVEAVSTERGAVTGNRRLKRVWRGNVALIGDAAGTVDAVTGEGLGLAFSQAVALAKCIEARDLAPYQKIHDQLALRPLLIARLMLTLDGRPGLQHRTLQVFEKRPEIFRRLLALHLGSLPPQKLLWDGLTLGWGLLTT
jgi:menaquinone-9 beta-reductase